MSDTINHTRRTVMRDGDRIDHDRAIFWRGPDAYRYVQGWPGPEGCIVEIAEMRR